MKKLKKALAACAPLVMSLLILAILALAAKSMTTGIEAKGKDSVEDAVRRAAAAYYAEEGVYPPDLDSVVTKYALQIDFDHYEIKYDIFAENLAPDITVIELKNIQRRGNP